jgi:hypothetical protein
MTALPAPDLFAQIFAPADEVAAGLALLARSPPLWPIDAARWAAALASVAAFEQRWGGQALMRGWSPPQLYGLHSTAPYANLAAMGASRTFLSHHWATWILSRRDFIPRSRHQKLWFHSLHS